MNDTPTILLADDNEELRVSTGALLSSAGYSVVEAGTVKEAMQAFERVASSVAVVVTDVNMPDGDGVSLAAQLRSIVPRVPIVFISSHIDERLGRRLAAGDVTFLAKPFGPVSLTEALTTARRVAARAVAAAPLANRARQMPPARQRKAPSFTSYKRTSWQAPAVWLAVAAGLILALGTGFELRRQQAPELPTVVSPGAIRSMRVEPLFPLGTLAARPSSLSWKPVSGADSYRVEIRRIGHDLVWENTVIRSSAMLPEAVRADLDLGVTFTWRVEALAEGTRIAVSEALRFQVGTLHETPAHVP